MQVFLALVDKYEKLIIKRKEVILELQHPQSTMILELLNKKRNELNKEIEEFESQKLYTQKEYDSNVVYKQAEKTGWENVDMTNRANW